MQKKMNWATILSALVLVSVLGFGIFGIASINSNLKNIDVDEDSIANAVLAGMNVSDMPDYEFPDYMVTEGEYELKVMEDKAFELAEDYIDSKDFKRLFEDIEHEGYVGIEDWEDITKIKVLDSGFEDVIKDSVTFELKVYFNVDGDDEETGRLWLEDVTVSIDELDYDDEFENAEVVELKQEDLEEAITKVKYSD